MARREVVTVTVTDDVDGSEAAETVAFAVEGVSYEIDLSAQNAVALRGDLTRRIELARKTQRSTRQGRGTAPEPVHEAAAIRAWAVANGIAVPARGRFPAAVIEQYHTNGGLRAGGDTAYGALPATEPLRAGGTVPLPAGWGSGTENLHLIAAVTSPSG